MMCEIRKLRKYETFFLLVKNLLLKSNERGATVVEMLVVLALFILISAAMLGLYVQHDRLYVLGQAQFESVGSARGALNGVSVYAVQARRVVPSVTITSTLYTTGTSTLVLEIPATTESGNIIEDIFDYAVFYRSGNKFYRVLAPGVGSARVEGTKFLADNITALVFTYNNPDFAQVKKITVSVTSTAGNSRIQEEHHETGEFVLRNY